MDKTLSIPLVSKIYRGDVVELHFKKPLGFTFQPGQCVEIYDQDKEARIYSIASGTRSDALNFIIKKLPHGKVSTWIYDELKEGDIVKISSEPYGFFEPGETDKDCVFIATGTGIAPFISYLETHRSDENLPLKEIIYGMRHAKEIVPVPFTNTTYCISQEEHKDNPKIYNGRVTTYLEENKDKIDSNTIYYVCGLDDALRDISEVLVNAGVPVENIIHEVFYFKSH